MVIPIAMLLHNGEEALGIPGILEEAQARLTGLLGAGWTLPSASEYFWALIVLTGVVLGMWLVALRWESLSYALVLTQAVMLLNALTHIGSAVAMRGYTPGLVTAVLVQPAVSVLVYVRVRRGGWMSRRQWILLPTLALVVYGPVTLAGAILILRRGGA